jgi:DUF4097 and DUF4098 domain-containing protein YvlB
MFKEIGLKKIMHKKLTVQSAAGKAFQGIAVLLLASPLLLAQQTRVFSENGKWVQETTGSLGTAVNLHVKVDMGAVRVEGGSQPEIAYEIRNRSSASSEDKARRQFDAYRINASLRGDTAWVTADWQGAKQQKFSSEFVIHVPREMQWVKVETDGGSVTAAGVEGRVDALSGGGSVHLDNVGGAVHAETGGGSISIGAAGGDVTLHTGGGNIQLTSAKGKVSAETGGGSVMLVSGMQGAELETGGGGIKIERCSGKVRVSTGGGSIDLGDIAGPVSIETGGGSIRLASAQGPVHAETGGGAINLNGVPSASAETGAGGIVVRFLSEGEHVDSVLHTGAGDITVYLPSNLNIAVRAEVEAADGHSIRSDFPEILVASEGGQWGPKTLTAQGSLNGGGPNLKVSTTAGNICFRRGNP